MEAKQRASMEDIFLRVKDAEDRKVLLYTKSTERLYHDDVSYSQIEEYLQQIEDEVNTRNIHFDKHHDERVSSCGKLLMDIYIITLNTLLYSFKHLKKQYLS